MVEKEIENQIKNENTQKNICYSGGNGCITCKINGKLMCSFNVKDTINFMIPVLAVWITFLVGIIRSFIIGNLNVVELVIFFVGYIGYLTFFFQVWENKVLCSHCPYYAFEDENSLHCYANYGLYKAWKYNPSPMSKSEQIQFIIGVAIFIGFPLIFLILGKAWVSLILSIIFSIIWIVSMHYLGCSKCPNFSCPLNNVPKKVIDEYLMKNDTMRKAWEKAGYKIG